MPKDISSSKTMTTFCALSVLAHNLLVYISLFSQQNDKIVDVCLGFEPGTSVW